MDASHVTSRQSRPSHLTKRGPRPDPTPHPRRDSRLRVRPHVTATAARGGGFKFTGGRHARRQDNIIFCLIYSLVGCGTGNGPSSL
ncbi:hypothetical protein LZ31DRAFT_556013 [Colletotrichum somersetense]|nr:hypothetical protein LZ31DRAFT_556013 [Colletotrichum somersetense]